MGACSAVSLSLEGSGGVLCLSPCMLLWLREGEAGGFRLERLELRRGTPRTPRAGLAAPPWAGLVASAPPARGEASLRDMLRVLLRGVAGSG